MAPVETIQLDFEPSLRPLLKRSAGLNAIDYPLAGRANIKHIVESLGIPHTEVGVIRHSERAVGFDFIPQGGQALVVEAIRSPLDVTRPSLLRPRPLPVLRFVVDVNVGKLARLLRTLGLDTAYRPDDGDAVIADLAESEGRIVLTRDTGLLKRRQIVYGRLIRSANPDAQLREVAKVFGLKKPFAFFSRCLRCNSLLKPVEKAAIVHRLEPKTRKYFHDFKQCPSCQRLFWPGSHQEDMTRRMALILGDR